MYLFQEVCSHGAETVNQYAGFQTSASMFGIRFDVNAVACRDYLFFAVNGKFEFAACYIGYLGVVMGVRCTRCSLFEFDFNEHHLSVVS